MKRRLRRKYFVDKKVQGKLLTRVAKYWIFSVAAIGILSTGGWLFISPGITGFVGSQAQMAMIFPVFVVAVMASFVILPFVLFDVVRFSNRFVGPMYRLRRCMQDLAAGKTVAPIHFRDGDFWQESADAFNGILARMNSELDAPHGEQCVANDVSDAAGEEYISSSSVR